MTGPRGEVNEQGIVCGGSPSRVTVALDAMGGDGGISVNVAGAVEAAREQAVSVVLVGHEGPIQAELDRLGTSGLDLRVRHASEVVEAQESPSAALRKKKDSSIRVVTDLVKGGEADAMVSAGNTGAVMAHALVILGALPGVERPAIAAQVPTTTGYSVLLDVGANLDPKPRHLLQFAIMGSVYAKQILGAPEPRVGLLSIGEEETKGNELTREAFGALEEEPTIRFVGNVEGADIFNGKTDVVVCDAFTGNVALKISESVAETIVRLFRQELSAGFRGKAGLLLLRPGLRRLHRRIDYAEYGGAPLLGVNGVVIIGHGRSSAKAIKNAIRVTAECVKTNMLARIREGVAHS